MEFIVIGYREFISKKSGQPTVMLFLGSKDPNFFGLKVDTVFCSPNAINGTLKETGKCKVTSNLQGFVQCIEVI